MSKVHTLKVRKHLVLGDLKLVKNSLIKAQVRSKVELNHKEEFVEYFELTIDSYAAYADSAERLKNPTQTLHFQKVEPFIVTTECEHVRFVDD